MRERERGRPRVFFFFLNLSHFSFSLSRQGSREGGEKRKVASRVYQLAAFNPSLVAPRRSNNNNEAEARETEQQQQPPRPSLSFLFSFFRLGRRKMSTNRTAADQLAALQQRMARREAQRDEKREARMVR